MCCDYVICYSYRTSVHSLPIDESLFEHHTTVNLEQPQSQDQNQLHHSGQVQSYQTDQDQPRPSDQEQPHPLNGN